jgi:hypothetical protein|eukprot:3333036-Prymnesium_polylepis.2
MSPSITSAEVTFDDLLAGLLGRAARQASGDPCACRLDSNSRCRSLMPVKSNDDRSPPQGHTFCTVESFEEVATAVADFAFATTRLPVIMSLEMHCSQRQQRHIAKMLTTRLGNCLLPVRSVQRKCQI